jgi:hypothetical protein
LEQKIAGQRGLIAGLTKDVMALRGEVRHQREIRTEKPATQIEPAQSAVEIPVSSPSSGSITPEDTASHEEPPQVWSHDNEALQRLANASNTNTSGAHIAPLESAPSVVTPPEQSSTSQSSIASEKTVGTAAGEDATTGLTSIGATAGSPEVTPEQLASAVKEGGRPLTDAEFGELQKILQQKEQALASARNDLEILKEKRPEPTTTADKTKLVFEKVNDIFSNPEKSVGDKLIAGVQALGAFLALWREAIGIVQDNLQQGGETGVGKVPDTKAETGEEEHHARLHEELKSSGKTPEDLIADKTKQAKEIFSKPDPNIQQATINQNLLIGEKAKLQAEYDAAKAATSPDLQALKTMEAKLTEIDQKIIEAQKVIDTGVKAREDAKKALEADVVALRTMNETVQTSVQNMTEQILEMTNVVDNQRFYHLIAALQGITFSAGPGLEPECTITSFGKQSLTKLGNTYGVSLDISVDIDGKVEDPAGIVKKMETLALAVKAADDAQKTAAKEQKA